MVEFIGVRRDNAIVPASAADIQELERVTRGKPLRVALTFDRSSKHNRWFHKLLAVVAEAKGVPLETLKGELKLRCGLIEDVFLTEKYGAVVTLASTAFNRMDETKFTEFRRAAVEVLFTDILPGVHRREVYKQVEELLGESCPW